MERVKEYIVRLKDAIGSKLVEMEGIYSNKDGHLRLAREVGYALTDFAEDERKHIIDLSYNAYVIGCNLKPILDTKDWIEKLQEGYNESLDYRNYNGEKLYNQIMELSQVDDFYDKIKLDFESLQLTKEEAVEMCNEIIKGCNIKNIIDFRDEIENIFRNNILKTNIRRNGT